MEEVCRGYGLGIGYVYDHRVGLTSREVFGGGNDRVGYS